MTEQLPPYVHRKIAKGQTYYYFAKGRRQLVRLPDLTDPLFQKRLAELYGGDHRRIRKFAHRRKRALAPKVYFIGGVDGPIKIGMSCDPEGRRREMAIGSPFDLKVLATTAGGHALEKAYHRRFGFAHMRGEWFERHPDIEAEIERLNAEERTGNFKTVENEA